MDFTLSIFRFNPKTDYLPCYKKYTTSLSGDLKLCDLLESIKKKDMFFDYPKGKNATILVNGYALHVNISLKDIAQNFGFELVLEPLSQKRSIHDLIIDTSDFDEVFELLKDLVGEEEKVNYDKYISYFYMSPALKYDENFQGTSFALFADDMIEKYPHLQDEILKILCDANHGIWYHSCLNHKIFPANENVEKKIKNLKQEIFKMFPQNPLVQKISSKFANS